MMNLKSDGEFRKKGGIKVGEVIEKEEQQEKGYITTAEAAKMLGVSMRTVIK